MHRETAHRMRTIGYLVATMCVVAGLPLIILAFFLGVADLVAWSMAAGLFGGLLLAGLGGFIIWLEKE